MLVGHRSERRLRIRRGLAIIPGEHAIQVRLLRRYLILRGSAATSILPQVLLTLDGTPQH